MRTLLEEQYAPITIQIGFIRADVDTVADEYVAWMRDLGNYAGRSVRVLPSLRDGLELLPPLTTELRRSLFVQMENGWTACFNNLYSGSDVLSTCWTVARRLRTHSVLITSVPNIRDAGRVRYASVQFSLRRFERDDPSTSLDHDRSQDRVVYASNDGGRWVFNAVGAVQPFEQATEYTARPIRKRFTSQMLEEYCNALGIGAFDEHSYLGRAVIVETTIARPDREKARSLAQAREWLNIEAGDAARYDG